MKKSNYIDNQNLKELTKFPDLLGTYKECISERKTPFNFLWLLWLLPFVFMLVALLQKGNKWDAGIWKGLTIEFVIFSIPILVYTCVWFVRRQKGKKVLIFQNGFIVQHYSFFGKLDSEDVYDYNKVSAMVNPKTMHFGRVYGIPVYRCTEVELWVREKDYTEYNPLNGRYKNRYETKNNYNFCGHAISTIVDDWTRYLLNLKYEEMQRYGYVVFEVPGYGEVKICNGYIVIDGLRLDENNMRYKFEDGSLYLYYRKSYASDELGQFEIPVNYMYNSMTFLILLQNLVGIK